MNKTNEPRIRYYFYRQKECCPGNIDTEGNDCTLYPESLVCFGSPRPIHYPINTVFCSIEKGY
ncbi:MAG: hypothetical protein ACWA45_02565 [Flavobacteriales bacterium]